MRDLSSWSSDERTTAVAERVFAVLADETGSDQPIAMDTRLEDDLGLFSMGVTRVLVRLEEQLGVNLDDTVVAMAELARVRDLVAMMIHPAPPAVHER
jgi:acyl carrier protein